jgi:hypothetical protein
MDVLERIRLGREGLAAFWRLLDQLCGDEAALRSQWLEEATWALEALAETERQLTPSTDAEAQSCEEFRREVARASAAFAEFVRQADSDPPH